jgi:hypothetical protein
MTLLLRRVNGWHPRVLADPNRQNRVRERVYILTDGECVKIGKCTKHPYERLHDLQTGSSRELRLLGYTAHMSERQAHRLYHRHRLRVEWFRMEVVRHLADWDYLNVRLVRELTEALEEVIV